MRIHLILSLIALFCICSSFKNKNEKALADKRHLAYIQKGEVFTMEVGTKKITQLTHTNGTVSDFKISNDSKYLVFTTAIHSSEDTIVDVSESFEHSIKRTFGETTIYVYDLDKMKVEKEYAATKTGALAYGLSNWIDNHELLIIDFRVMCEYLQILSIDEKRIKDPLKGLTNEQIAVSGLYSHRVLALGQDYKIIDSASVVEISDLNGFKKKSIFENTLTENYVCISNDKSLVYWSLSNEIKSEHEGDPRDYTLLKRDLSNKNEEILFKFKDVGLGFSAQTTVSPNDSLICFATENKRNSPDELTFLNIISKVKVSITGKDCNWLSSSKVAFINEKKAYLYDINEKKEEKILDDVEQIFAY